MQITYQTVLIFILLAVCCVLFATIFYLYKKALEERKRKKLFLSTIAHDLRSPLTNIKGFADLLLSGETDGENAEKALFVISSEAARLASLATRLTDNSEKLPVNKEIFGICELLRTIFLSLEGKMSAKQLKCEFSFDDDDEIYVHSDKALVHEALFNLCDNAVKYCESEKIYIKLENSGDKVKVSVANKTTDTKFSDYFKAGARGRNDIYGTGLGLYIAKKLIDACDSSLSAEKNGEMISFNFTLPYVKD